VMAAAQRQGRAAAAFAPTAAGARRWFGLGAGMVACGVDTGHLAAALRGVVAAAREA
jgi:2-keto-3-deoxy-L-rhamnonate aldolase RhmA